MTSVKKKKALAQGRPPFSRTPGSRLSSKATRNLIRSHHNLHKSLHKAQKEENLEEIAEIEKRLSESGGLRSYQKASLLGQSAERGGDSSEVLMKWLNDHNASTAEKPDSFGSRKLKMLEVGALSTENACSRSNMFSITRIDLHAQGPGIEQQDFMQRPLPTNVEEKFNVISLSLVLNYSPVPADRGEMLRRTRTFLHQRGPADDHSHDLFPSLFLVLPAPCVLNSRYLTGAHLVEIMERVGYRLAREKVSAKLAYYLFVCQAVPSTPKAVAAGTKKLEVNPGKKRNNFCILLNT